MLIYLHGFNSSAQSHKAQVLAGYLQAHGLGARYACPVLPPLAGEAIKAIEAVVARHAGKPLCFVGSSLGGYYATHLAEKHAARAVLLNPAIDPHVGLRDFLGMQKNLHTGEPYELTAAHLQAWERLWVPRITPERYLVIVETGDEVLDYRRALERYAGAEHIVVQGGDHSLVSFPQHLPRIVRFAGLEG